LPVSFFAKTDGEVIKVARFNLIFASLIVIGLIFIGQSSAKIDPKTIVGMWSLDEGTGNQAKDSSGKDNHGTLKGPQWVKGKIGANALSFDGVDDCVEIASSPSLDPGKGDMTWCAWVKTTATGNRYVYSNYESPTDRVECRVQDGKIRLYIRSTDNTTTWRDSTTTFNDGKWRHIASVWKGSLKTATIDNYVDGGESNAAYGAQDITNASVVPLGGNDYIGARGGLSDYFDGLIDEVVIFNVALTKDDIQTIMQGNIGAIEKTGKLTTTWAAIK